MIEVRACAWTISKLDGKERIQGGGVIPGTKKDKNSYRAELGGQLGIAAFVESVDIPQGAYQLNTICDGLAALNKVGMDLEYVKCSAKNVDIISMITDLWNKFAFIPMPEYVYGHQDASKEPLSMLEILNTEMIVISK